MQNFLQRGVIERNCKPSCEGAGVTVSLVKNIGDRVVIFVSLWVPPALQMLQVP